VSTRGAGWPRRSLRRLLLGSGPLKRRSDRIQMIARLLVVLGFLTAPSVAVFVADATKSHLEAVATAQAAERHQVRAVLLEDAVRPPGATYYEGAPAQVTARATWAAPEGGTRTGVVLIRTGRRAGTAVPVWVDDGGSLADPPLDRTEISGTALSMAALSLIGVPLAAWLLYALLCAALDTHRQRRWAQGWAAVEPVWVSRLL
jgi:hypothetical protein